MKAVYLCEIGRLRIYFYLLIYHAFCRFILILVDKWWTKKIKKLPIFWIESSKKEKLMGRVICILKSKRYVCSRIFIPPLSGF